MSPAHSSSPITFSCSSKGSLTSARAVGRLRAFSFSCAFQFQVSGVGSVTLTAASYFIASPAGLGWLRKSCLVGGQHCCRDFVLVGVGAYQVMLMRRAVPDTSSCACAVGSWGSSKLKHDLCWVSTLPVLKCQWHPGKSLGWGLCWTLGSPKLLDGSERDHSTPGHRHCNDLILNLVLMAGGGCLRWHCPSPSSCSLWKLTEARNWVLFMPEQLRRKGSSGIISKHILGQSCKSYCFERGGLRRHN